MQGNWQYIPSGWMLGKTVARYYRYKINVIILDGSDSLHETCMGIVVASSPQMAIAAALADAFEYGREIQGWIDGLAEDCAAACLLLDDATYEVTVSRGGVAKGCKGFEYDLEPLAE